MAGAVLVATPATQALREVAARLSRLGGWSAELETAVLSLSQEACSILEVPAGFQCSFEDALAFCDPQDQHALVDAFRRCAAASRPFDIQLGIVSARGRRARVRVMGEPVYAAPGAVARVQGALQDITALVHVHDENTLLAERLATTLESMTEGFYVLDHQWTITYANSEAARVMGMGRTEVVGRNLWHIFPEALGTIFHHDFERALQTGRPVEFESYYEPLRIWVQVRAFPSSFGLAVAFKDVTQRRWAEEEVARLNADLEQRVLERTAELRAANRELEAFAYAIAHDLRTPLCAGKAFAHALELSDRDRVSADGRDHLRRIGEALEFMDDMTQGLLSLAHLSKAAIRRERVDLARLARDIVAMLGATDPAREVEVRVQPDLVATGDRVLLGEALLNLIGNAWKFTRGTRDARIEVGATANAEGKRTFFVKDNGPGFDMEDSACLFEPFVRLHDADGFEGTGIGLATVRKIIWRHGGSIRVESARGSGACFSFSLPDGG
jgi:PAS domain S-box-containing protein